MTLKNYTGYSVTLTTKLHRDTFGSGTSIKIVDPAGEPATVAWGFSTLNVLRLPPHDPVYISLALMKEGDDLTRVAAGASAVLNAEGPRMPAGEYLVHGNERCPLQQGQTEQERFTACATEGSGLYLGRNNDNTHNSQWKFVVAHELGHLVQFKGSGVPRRDYDADGNDSGVCGCGFVDDPADRSHCMQSKETYGAAEAEGFAHMFAARTWNYGYPGSCTFVYYKNFNEGGGVILRPPLVRSCVDQVKWLETKCAASQRGVEWDWMNFQRAVTVATAPTPLDDLLDIYKQACGGTSCTGVQRSFQQLAVAADLKFGQLDARAQQFRLSGSAYGVDF
jgi:hypothetical protein